MSYDRSHPGENKVVGKAKGQADDLWLGGRKPRDVAVVAENSQQVSTRWILWVGASVLAAALLVDQLRVVLGFGRSHTNEDQTILWYAGRELLNGRIYEPNFFGQRYNTTFETIPGAILHSAGVQWGTALPMSSAGLVTLAWVLLAAAAYRRGQPIAALLALAAPLVMRVQYLLLFDAPRGVLAGDLGAVLAVAIALSAAHRYQVRLCSLVAIGGLAILWENAAALVVIPVLVYVICTDWSQYKRRVGQTALLLVAAALPPLAWLLFATSWWNAHHIYLTFPGPATKPHLSVLFDNLHHLSAYFSDFAPALAPVAGVAVVVVTAAILLAVVLAVRWRSLALLLATVSLLILILLALTSSSVVEPGLYLAGSRILLPLPFAVWFLCFGALDSAKRTGVRGPSHRGYYVAAVVVVATISLLVTQITFSSVATRSIRPTVGVSVTNPTLLSAHCAALAKVYRSTNAQLLATNNSDDAYGCAAIAGLNTLVPFYDRRAWLTQDALREPLERILVVVPSCSYVDSEAGQCIPEPAGVVLVRSRPVPPPRTLDRIKGIEVRVGTLAFH